MSSIFQRAYDWIDRIKTPMWLRELLQGLQDQMVIIAKKAGEAYIDYVTDLVVEAAAKKDWTGAQKLQYVFDNSKKGFGKFMITIKDSELNFLIETLVGKLKQVRGK